MRGASFELARLPPVARAYVATVHLPEGALVRPLARRLAAVNARPAGPQLLTLGVPGGGIHICQ